jgi:hypothetical protein
MQQLAIVERDCVDMGIAQLQCVRSDDVTHRLDVGRRARNHPQDLGGGRLLLEGLGQLSVPRLQLREQAHVFDRDDRLIGEGFEERDLLGREGVDLGPSVENGAQRRALPQQRRRHDCPGGEPSLSHAGHDPRKLRLGRHDVLDVDRPSVHHGPPGHGAASGRNGVADRQGAA